MSGNEQHNELLIFYLMMAKWLHALTPECQFSETLHKITVSYYPSNI